MVGARLFFHRVVVNPTLIGFVVLFLSTFTSTVNAQSPNVALAGTESPSVTDGVDVFSGRLENVLPLISVQGRGDASVGLYLPLRNSQWRVKEFLTLPSSDRTYYFYKPELTGPGYNYPAGFAYARGGYSTLGVLSVETKFTGWYFMETPSVTELTFTSNNGSIIHFRDVLTNGEPYDARGRGCVLSAYQPPNPPPACSRGRVFRSIDGGNMTFVADADIYDIILYDAYGNPSPWSAQSNIAGTLYLSNGTRMRVENNFNNITKITDRNGNYVNIEYVTENGYTFNFLKKIRDSLNREISISYGDNSQASYFDEIVYKGFGSAERRIRINYTGAGNVMAPGESLAVPIFAGVTTRCYMLSGGQPCDPTPAGPSGPHYSPSTAVVPSSIVLPNGREYQFYYNRYLELARLKSPAGAYTDYNYSGIIGAGDDGFTPPTLFGGGEIQRRVSSVKNFDETDQLINEKTLSNIPQLVDQTHPSFPMLDNVTIELKDGSGTVLSKSRHYFYETAGSQSLYTFLPASFGKEFKTEILDPVSQNVLRRTETTWEQRDLFPWCTGMYLCAPNSVTFPTSVPAVDPRITEVKITLETGQVTKKTFSYDQHNNVTDVYEYDYAEGQPGPFLRRTHSDYVTDPNYTSYTGSYLLRLKSQSWVSSDINGNSKATLTQFENDNYASDAHLAPLLPRSNVSGFDVNYHAGFTRRGNLTSVTSFTNAQNQTGPISSYLQYDIAGNVVKAIDARDNATTFDFTDRFGAPDTEAQSNAPPIELASVGQSSYAFATKVTNALGQVAYLQFDYYLGRSINVEDINGVVSSSSFNDPLDRPTQTIHAANDLAARSQTSVVYDDANRVITTTSDQSVFNDPYPLKSQTLYDSFGRAIESRQYEGGANYTAAQTQYDALGRAFKTSNPFRPLNQETPVWTTTGFDVLGRAISVTTPDSAVITSSYSGNTATVTDQTGKQRKSISDALGRLNQVYEAPNDPNYNYLTSYSYDVLDNLITVNQGSQTRSFFYDSLKRLVSATNPESGTICYGTIVSGQCQGNGYDANGNVTITTDARGIVTTFVYDPLNRLTARNYSDNTPAVTVAYDSTTITNGKGRLASISSSVSTSSYGGYDAGGQPLGASQTVGAQTYSMSYGYDRAGHVKTINYPSGHTVTYNYDGAGRLADKDAQNLAFTGNLGDGTQRTYAAGITYASNGGWIREQFGTNTLLYNKRQYNIRQQLYDMRVSTVNDAGNWNRGAIVNYYSLTNYGPGMTGSDTNGNLYVQQHLIPDDDAISSHSFMQQNYDYDPLNRIKLIGEYQNGTTQTGSQSFGYDRFGNRTVSGSSGNGINNLPFEVEASTNRLYAPGDLVLADPSRRMRYDQAGNLMSDTYSGQGTRTYDANNRMISSAGILPAVYGYDGNGNRVKRSVNGSEIWQVYGVSGELLAEYAANAAPANPQKEYGYRNGELLITTDTGSAAAPSALTTTPPTSGATITLNWTAAAGATSYRIERKVVGGSFTSVGTSASTTFADTATGGSAYLYKVCAANGSGNCISGYSNIALGAAVTFPTDPTITSYSEDPQNVTSMKAAHITELRTAVNAVRSLAGSSAASYSYSVANGGLIHVEDVRELRERLGEALTALGIQLPSYTDSTLKGFIEDPLNATTIKAAHIRELRQAATKGIGGSGGGGSLFQIRWLVTDHLGTPRMIFDQTGSLANVSRHDYLPFGEELFAGTGGRTTAKGYSASDNVRQKFTGYEHDAETGLEFAQARHYASVQGRFTSSDPIAGSIAIPQSLNTYSYVMNNPMNSTDPTGLSSLWDVFDVANGYLNALYIDGFLARPQEALFLLQARAGVSGPTTTTHWNPDANLGEGEWEFFRANASGEIGWFNIQGMKISIDAYVNNEHAGHRDYFESFAPNYVERYLGTKDAWPPRPLSRDFGWDNRLAKPATKPAIPELRNPNLDNAKNRIGARPNLQDELNKVKPQRTGPKGWWRGGIRALGQLLNVYKIGMGPRVPVFMIWTPEIQCAVLNDCERRRS